MTGALAFSGEVHPAAELFPLMGEEELAALAADIKTNGLRQPIVLDHEGRLVDGRNRLSACSMAKVKPEFVNLNGEDPLAFVVSLNVMRRNLRPSQRAIAAAEAWPLEEAGHGGARASGQSSHLKTRERLARLFDVGAKSIQQARALETDLAAEVKAGTRPLADAYEEHQRRQGKDKSTRETLARLRLEYPDLLEKVEADQFTLADALTEAERREAAERQLRWAATMNVLDGLAHFDRDAAEDQASVQAALIDQTIAASRGEAVTPERLRRASAWALLLANELERTNDA